jgi:hypothetical protein
MGANPHFATVASWEEAAEMLVFRPLQPAQTAGFRLDSLAVHVRDHKRRELGRGGRSLEAHYGGFVVSQAHRGESEARRSALSVAYGLAARSATVHGHEARVYELGPEPPPEDIDGRSPAVVVWHDAGMFYMVASDCLPSDVLLGIAASMYPRQAS